MNKILQIGQLIEKSKFANPQHGRVYSPLGIAPTLGTFAGGERVYKIIVYEKNNNTNRRF